MLVFSFLNLINRMAASKQENAYAMIKHQIPQCLTRVTAKLGERTDIGAFVVLWQIMCHLSKSLALSSQPEIENHALATWLNENGDRVCRTLSEAHMNPENLTDTNRRVLKGCFLTFLVKTFDLGDK